MEYARIDVNPNETKELEFKRLIEWVSETRLDNEISRYQLRCLWTAFCINNSIFPSDGEYDLNLGKIWNEVGKNVPATAGEVVWEYWIHFAVFMQEYLIGE